jgi:hypothetical protein
MADGIHHVANDKQTLACLRALDDATIKLGLTEGRTCPIAYHRKIFGVLPPFLMKCFIYASSPLQTLNGVIAEIHKYASEHLNKKGAKMMWRSFYPLLQRLWIAAREEEEGGSNHSHFFLTNTLRPTSDVHAIKEGADIENKYLI